MIITTLVAAFEREMEAANIQPSQTFLEKLLATQSKNCAHHSQLFERKSITWTNLIIMFPTCVGENCAFYGGHKSKLPLPIVHHIVNRSRITLHHRQSLHAIEQHFVCGEQHIGDIQSARFATGAFHTGEFVKFGLIHPIFHGRG